MNYDRDTCCVLWGYHKTFEKDVVPFDVAESPELHKQNILLGQYK